MSSSDEEWAIRRVKIQIADHLTEMEKRIMGRLDHLEILLTEIAEHLGE